MFSVHQTRQRKYLLAYWLLENVPKMNSVDIYECMFTCTTLLQDWWGKGHEVTLCNK
jgi:hypothetical protein